jgi:predicted acyl esterase
MMSAEDLTRKSVSEQEEAKQAERKKAEESMRFSAALMSDYWLMMWQKLTGQDKVPTEVAKGWMDCYIHHTLVSTANANMADKMIVMTKLQKGHGHDGEDGPQYPDKEF